MSQQYINRYIVYSELDRGGMAIVYSAHDPNFDRNVAIKVLPREFLHDRTFRARFQREAQAVAILEHDAIVPVYDFGEEDGQMYLVMRYMVGGSLVDRIAQGAMPLAEVAHIVERLAPALDRAHSMGIIHRDLKPANILFDEDGEAYITDFGIARLTAATVELTASNVIVGTPAYMSPEQARDSSDIDGRSDVYSLGVIVFQMLTGKLPYHSKSSVGYITAHVTEPVPNILDFNPSLPPACRRIIERVMAKDPDERYRLAVDLAADLKTVAEADSSADTLRSPLHKVDMTAVSAGGSTRPTPLPAQTYDQVSRPPAMPRVRKARPTARRWNVAGAWIAGAMLAAVVVCVVLGALGVFDGLSEAFGPTGTPPLPAIEIPTKVVTKIPILPVLPTMTLTDTPAVTPAPTQTRIPATRVPPTATHTLTPSPSPSPIPTLTPTATIPGLERGLTNISFSLRKVNLAPDEPIWFDFSVTNSNPSVLGYGFLGAEVYYSDGRLFFLHKSLQDGVLAAGQTVTKSDSFPISTPGTYGVRLIICYDKLSTCNTPAGEWERLSPLTTFVIAAGSTPTPTATATTSP